MSSVHGAAGDTGWAQSYSCDFCSAKVERKGTGRMERVPLSITDPRSRGMVAGHTYAAPPEIEYEEQRFDKGALDGWGSMSRTRAGSDYVTRVEPQEFQTFDFCPTCFQVMLDQALERARQNPTCTEVQFGVEVSPRPFDPADYLIQR